MSLTRELANAESWVRLFLAERFGELTTLARSIRGDLRLLTMRVAPLRSGPAWAQTVGKAFEFRLRLHLGWQLSESAALRRGARIVAIRGGGPRGEVHEREETILALLATPPPDGDSALAHVGVVVAWIDDVYRGNPWSDGLTRIVDRMGYGAVPTWLDCSAGVDDLMAVEIAALMKVAEQEFAPGTAICGPEFAGSASVHGADADFVLNGCLYDVKTTKAPRDKLLASLRQLLSYVLLDWRDEYELERAGFYFARQGKRMSWSLPWLVEAATGTPDATLERLRRDFWELAERQV